MVLSEVVKEQLAVHRHDTHTGIALTEKILVTGGKVRQFLAKIKLLNLDLRVSSVFIDHGINNPLRRVIEKHV